MPNTRVEEIRARVDAATPGHWGTSCDGQGTYTVEAQPRFVPGSGTVSVSEGIVATLAGGHGDEQTYHDARFTAHAREDVPFLLDRIAELEAGMTETEVDAIHTHFSLSYANYLVLPRTLLQSMPDAWQTRFVRMLDQLESAFQHVEMPEAYKVDAATEHIVGEMSETQLKMARITADWFEGETPPKDLSPAELAEWKDQHETDLSLILI